MSLIKETKTHIISADDLKNFIKESVEKETGRKVMSVNFIDKPKKRFWLPI